MRQEIFINSTELRRHTQRVTALMIIFIGICIYGFFAVPYKERILIIFISGVGIIGLITFWLTHAKKIKHYLNQPYLILDELCIQILDREFTQTVNWRDVQNIDFHQGTRHSPSYYFIETNKIYRLDNDLITKDIIVTLKRYAEKYGTAKFIY